MATLDPHRVVPVSTPATATRMSTALRSVRRLAPPVVVAALALMAAGCGGEDDGDDRGKDGARTVETPAGTRASGREASPAEREAVRKAVVRLFRTDDVEVICERSLTPRLFGLIFTGPAACRKATSEEDDDDEPPDRVEVSDVRIRGDRATAMTKLIGGDTAGAEGALVLIKGADGWRADDFSAPFLRSSVSASLENERKIPAAVSRCIDARLTAMADPEFKRLALALVGKQREANVRLLEILADCERKRGGVTSVRRELEETVTETLGRAGARKNTISCALRRLRTTLPDRLLVRLAAEKGRASRTRITREVVAAAVACGARRPGAPDRLSPA